MRLVQNASDLDQLIFGLGDRGMSSESLEMVEGYIKSCWDKGVEVILDPNLTDAFGTYCPESNTLTLGEKAISCNIEFVETLEHEFVHVLQDQLAGIHNAEMTPLGIPTTETANTIVNENYIVDEHTHQLESEAFTLEHAIENPMAGAEFA